MAGGALHRRRAALLYALAALGFATLLGGVVRFSAAGTAVARPYALVGDEIYYAGTAVGIAEGRGHVSPLEGQPWAARPYGARAAWPPGNAWWLSNFVEMSEGRARIVQFPLIVAQLWAGTLLVALVGALGWLLFDRFTGIAAACVAALYPNLVAYSHYLWAENLFMVLATAGLCGLAWGQRRPGALVAVATGVAFGLAGLTREVGLLMALAGAAWWLLTPRPDGRRMVPEHVALMLLVAGLVVLPWTVRNYNVLQRFVPVSHAGWLGMREGNTFGGPSWLRPDVHRLDAFRRTCFGLPGEMACSDFAREQSLALIRAEQPGWIFRKASRTTALLFAPDSFVFKKLSRNSYRDVPPAWRRAILVVTSLGYVAVMVLAIPAVGAAPGEGRRTLPLWIGGAVVGLHLLANASSRYRLPLLPLLIPYATWGALHWRAVARELRGRRRIAAAIVLGVFLGFCVPFFVPDAVSLWTVGTYVEFDRQ